MNGNRWVGTGHNAVFTDFAGQDWYLYHAVDRNDPYFAGAVGFTKRPALMDPLDWVDGWPTVRGGQLGLGHAAARAGRAARPARAEYQPRAAAARQPGNADRPRSRTSSTAPRSARSGAGCASRRPARTALTGGTLRFDTQDADLYVDSNNASVLTEPAPSGNYVVETKVS